MSWKQAQLSWLLWATLHAPIFFFFTEPLSRTSKWSLSSFLCDREVTQVLLHPGESRHNLLPGPLKQQTSRLSQRERCIFRAPEPPSWCYGDLSCLHLQMVLGLCVQTAKPTDGYLNGEDRSQPVVTVVGFREPTVSSLMSRGKIEVKASSIGDGIYLAPQAPSIHPSIHWLIQGFTDIPLPREAFQLLL